jgi:hypothetical protein
MPTPVRHSRLSCLLMAALLAAGPVLAAGDDAPTDHKAKQALDDRADPNMHMGEVGKGSHMGSRATQPGIYLGDKSREAVHRWYAEHPVQCRRGCAAPAWEIGAPLPARAPVTAVPAALLASLPKAPPGVRYVRMSGDILLVASGSRMVVDGIKAP